ncbi:Sodium channel protein type 4 subunit alpha [Paramecium bursaria]
MSAQRRGSAERKSVKRMSELDIKFKESKFNVASKQNIILKKPLEGPYQRASNRKISQISQRKQSVGSVRDASKRKQSLMIEFKDILQNDLSDFSDSSESDDESKQSNKNLELKYSKHKPNELEQVSMVKSRVSKGVITIGSIKESSHMKETFKSIKKMQSNKSFAQESHKRMKMNSNLSMDIGSMHSQRSSKRNLDYAQLQRMIDHSNIQDDERRKYQKLLEELEKNCDEQNPSQRDNVRKKVRQTFVKLFNSKHLEIIRDDSSSHMYNESVYINKSNIHSRHASVGDAVTSILENQLVKKKLDDKLIKNFMQEFVQNDSNSFDQESEELHDDQDDSSKIVESEEEMNDQEMELLKEPTAIVLKNEVKKYNSKYRRDPNVDYYPLEWITIQNLKWILNELLYHYDNLPFLRMRMVVITFMRTVNFIANKIINHKIFVLAVIASIIYNLVVFLEEFESDGSESDAFKEKKLLVLTVIHH